MLQMKNMVFNECLVKMSIRTYYRINDNKINKYESDFLSLTPFKSSFHSFQQILNFPTLSIPQIKTNFMIEQFEIFKGEPTTILMKRVTIPHIFSRRIKIFLGKIWIN